MKILVTGGAGFIGSHIVDAYIADGHEVIVVDNLSAGKKEHLNPKVKFYCMDVCNPEVESIFKSERPEVLNHHAAQIDIRRSTADPITDCKVNVVGLLNIMESSRKNGLKKVIFASSGGAIYGEQKYFPADEEHPTNPISPYGVAKLTCEKYLYYYYLQHKIPYVVFRYANIYGPRQNAEGEAGVVAIFINKMLNGGQPLINGDGKQTRDYVYVSDVVFCNLEAIRSDIYGIYNVGTGIETKLNDLVHRLIPLSGSDVNFQYAPARSGEQRRSSLKMGALQKAPPTSLGRGLQSTIEWFRKLNET